MERLLLCLWELMNSVEGMNAMLSSDGAGVLALLPTLHGASDDEPLACNLYFLARAIDPAATLTYSFVRGSDGNGDEQTESARSRVAIIAIKLLTSAAAYSASNHSHERVVGALRHVEKLPSAGSWQPPSWAGGHRGGGNTHRLFRRLAEGSIHHRRSHALHDDSSRCDA